MVGVGRGQRQGGPSGGCGPWVHRLHPYRERQEGLRLRPLPSPSPSLPTPLLTFSASSLPLRQVLGRTGLRPWGLRAALASLPLAPSEGWVPPPRPGSRLGGGGAVPAGLAWREADGALGSLEAAEEPGLPPGLSLGERKSLDICSH